LLNTCGWIAVRKRKEVQPLLSTSDKELIKRNPLPAPATNLQGRPSDSSEDTVRITIREHKFTSSDGTFEIYKNATTILKHYSPTFMYRVQVPCNHNGAVWLDLENNNTKWQDAEQVKLDSIFSYEALKDLGHISGLPHQRDTRRSTCT
jgi:hypothetical protein